MNSRPLSALLLILVTLAAGGCQAPDPEGITDRAHSGTTELLLVSDVEWEQLNPARGDASPQAGTLWGDRKGTVPTGFLAKFVDGFSSPPHIHNATYRAVVIEGRIHNDDPDATPMWMPAGSFWTQPKGEVHITAAKGSQNIALVEIDQGPYLVQPPEEAFDSGERPINIDPSNLIWIDPPGGADSASIDGDVKMAYLWGSLEDGRSNGTFIKLQPGFEGAIHSKASTFRAVVIEGRPQLQQEDTHTLEPGSYFGSSGDAVHPIASDPTQETVIYIRTDGPYEIKRSRDRR